jgi:multidrug resistance efflux pump
MKFVLLAFLATSLAFAQDEPTKPAPAPSVNQLKMQLASLSAQNAQLSAHVDGLQKELESTRAQLTQLQTNALATELCSAAGIAVKECSIAQDGTASKIAPPAPAPAPAAAKPAEPTPPAAK